MENKLIITPSTVISVELLKSLCEEYTAEIGAGEYSGYLSKIRIRYVMERGKFGYANFGDFFFLCDDLYVWIQCVCAKFKTYLVITFTSCTMRNRISIGFSGNFN